MRSRLVGGLTLAVVLAGLAGCGGDGDEPGAAKQAYIEASDVVCRETFDKTSSLTGRDQQTAEKASEEWSKAYDRLNSIPIPGETEDLAKQFVTDINNLSMSYTAAARALALNQQDKANKAFDDVTTIKARSARVANDYGYEDCAGINES